MLQNLSGWHFLVILVVILLLFGAPKLPGLAKSLGQSMRIFRKEVRTMKDENGDDVPDTRTARSTAADSARVDGVDDFDDESPVVRKPRSSGSTPST